MIVLSGMHLSLATHLCGGELSSAKLSFTAEKAGCGMKTDENASTTEKSFNAVSCCKDVVSFYTVDTNYNPSTIQLNKPVHQLLQAFYIPTTVGIQYFNALQGANTNIQPPGKFIASAVSLPDICVFLI